MLQMLSVINGHNIFYLNLVFTIRENIKIIWNTSRRENNRNILKYNESNYIILYNSLF